MKIIIFYNLLKQRYKKISHFLCLILFSLLIITVPFQPVIYAMTENDLNSILNNTSYYDPEACDSSSAGTEGTIIDGSGNAEKIWNFFISNGLSAEQAAGIMGNFQAESGLMPNRVQGHAINDGSDTMKIDGVTGYGLAQWTYITLQQGLHRLAVNTGVKDSDLGMQLQYTLNELHRAGVWDIFKDQKTVKRATLVFMLRYERPHDIELPAQQARINLAERWYKKFTNGMGGTSSVGTTSIGDNKTVVVIDPGHSGEEIHEKVPNTQIDTFDYPNGAEDADVYGVAKKLENKLDSAGYKVILTKNSVNDTVSLVKRAQIANSNNADIAVSIHDDAGASAFGGSFAMVYPQKVGQYRGIGSNQITFKDTQVASKSNKYATNIKNARKQNGDPSVKIGQNNFNGRGLTPGNIAFVQLLSKIPWIYNESGGPLNEAQQTKYATGLFEGIKNSIGPNEHNDGTSSISNGCEDENGSSGVVAGDIVKTALNLAWDKPVEISDNKNDDEPGRQAAKPEYVKAKDKYNSAAKGLAAYTDCGVFVATAIRASGVDSNYWFRGTTLQKPYVEGREGKYEKIPNNGTTANLKPGDIFISSGHTFIYVGQDGGKAGNIRQASWGTQPPNAPWSMAAPSSEYSIYRVKK